jgi:hypothetical protein
MLADDRPVVLLCTSNGVGLGHLARMMAIARALEPQVRPVIFTLSAAVAIPVAQGFEVEHLPSAGHAGLLPAPWHRLLEDRVDHLIRRLQPQVVMFDGVHPYQGLVSALISHRRRVMRVWQRRAMWRPGIGAESLASERYFDAVIEPGEYAAAADAGLTVALRSAPHVHTVAPIVYDAGHLDRAAACQELGFDPAKTNPNGSGISLGHPIGATGGRILATMLNEMRRRDARFGLETMCIGGGQGLAAIFEKA